MCGIRRVANGLVEEFRRLLRWQRKTQRDKLALLTAAMLDVRSANLMELAAALPREADRTDMRYQWISRVLGSALIDPDAMMEPFAREVLARAAGDGQPMVLILDHSKRSGRHQVLMLALRHGERALPLAWRVEATQGPTGFGVQRDLLGAVVPWLPQGVPVCLMTGQGDRKTKTGARPMAAPLHSKASSSRPSAPQPTSASCATPAMRRPGSSPWRTCLAPSPRRTTRSAGASSRCSPSSSRAASASPTRKSNIPTACPACCWSWRSPSLRHLDGLAGRQASSGSRRKKRLSDQPKKVARSKVSWFTRGLRRIPKLLQAALPLPPLWST